MEKKSFKKYFTQKKTLFFLGIVVAVAGALLYAINYLFIHEYFFWQSSVLALVAGIVIVICHFSIRVRDGAVDEYAHTFHTFAENELEGFVNEGEKHPVKVYNFTSGCYAYDDPQTAVTVFGGDATPRCEKYSATAMVYTTQNLYAASARLDLINGDVICEKTAISLKDIVNIRVADESFTKTVKGKNKYFECFKLKIQTDDQVYSFSVRNDAVTDEAVAKISRMAESKRRES